MNQIEELILSEREFEIPESVRAWLSKRRLLYIDGEFTESLGKQCFETLNPATGEVLSEIAWAKASDVERAVQAAKRSFEEGKWRGLGLSKRAEILRRLAELIDEHRPFLAVLESLDTGKPIRETWEGDIPRSAMNFRFFCDYAGDEDLVFDNEREKHTARREPAGVVALITPWNLPLYLETWKLAPALLMGNSVVLKPSELTPLTASYLSELMHQVGIPKGVFNLLQGMGENDTGEFLVNHREIAAISFTGETSTGRAIMKAAAEGPTKVSFELGGKGHSLVFADADLEAAVNEAVRAGFRNQGQICLAMPKILIDRSVYEEFKTAFVEKASKLRVGPPLDLTTQMGALVGQAHFEKVSAYLRRVEPPAQILTGGITPKGLESGYFLEPTVIAGLSATHPISCDEVFGPVVSLHPFDSEEEALEIVNASSYGLAASIWTRSESRAERVAAAIRTGLVWINCWFVRDLRVPFGGIKNSGVGREGGKWSLDFFSEWKSIGERKGAYATESRAD